MAGGREEADLRKPTSGLMERMDPQSKVIPSRPPTIRLGSRRDPELSITAPAALLRLRIALGMRSCPRFDSHGLQSHGRGPDPELYPPTGAAVIMRCEVTGTKCSQIRQTAASKAHRAVTQIAGMVKISPKPLIAREQVRARPQAAGGMAVLHP